MTMAHVPSAVWLLDGGHGHLPPLVQALARHYRQVQWSALAHPPGDTADMAHDLQSRRLQLVLMASEQATASPAEIRWRDWLQQGGWPHAVQSLPAPPHDGPVNGGTVDPTWLKRLATCVGLVQRLPPAAGLDPQRWHGVGCEGCSDPACERRLFQDLLARRSVQA